MKKNLYSIALQSIRIVAKETHAAQQNDSLVQSIKQRFPKLVGVAAIWIALASFAHANELEEHVERLQKAASIAYEKMMQTKQMAENSAQDAVSAEKKMTSLKQKLTAAEQEYAAAKKKSDQAKLSFERATEQWKQASDTLAVEWNRSMESR